jgi:hypothetical protein
MGGQAVVDLRDREGKVPPKQALILAGGLIIRSRPKPRRQSAISRYLRPVPEIGGVAHRPWRLAGAPKVAAIEGRKGCA